MVIGSAYLVSALEEMPYCRNVTLFPTQAGEQWVGCCLIWIPRYALLLEVGSGRRFYLPAG